jgi:1,2-diacylglycerol 3-alpha-glucosyltransferase
MTDYPIRSIVFVLPSLLHYHFPRFRSLGNALQHNGITFTHIELCSHQKAYPWQVGDQSDQFTNITLFPEKYLEQIPGTLLWKSLKSHLETLRPEILFLYGYSLGVYRQARSWAEKQGIAVVILSDSNLFDKRRYWLFEFLKSLVVARFDAAFVGGTSSREYMQSLGISAERIVTGFDVVDNQCIAQRAYENQKDMHRIRQRWDLPERYFLFVGRMIPEKNLLLLLKAYQKYAESQERWEPLWHLVLCGHGPEEEKIKTAVQNLPGGIQHKIRLLGHVDQPEVFDLFSVASCFILPSFSESWGLVINEAMACGLPVLVTNRAGCAKDLVQENENGWTFNPLDARELESRLIAMSNLDDISREKMGQCSRKIVEDWGLDRFSWGALESARIALRHQRETR